MHTIQDLKMRQALPLDVKVRMTKQRIREWVDVFGIDGVYVSFSGGKDSTVLLHIAKQIYPDIKAAFVDTLEYAKAKGVTRTTVCKWIKQGKLKAERYGRKWYIMPVC